MKSTTKPKIYLFNIPSNAGCLDLGTELSPKHFRVNGLVENLRNLDLDVLDLGDVSIPEMERHNRPPVRNFPFPRIVWEQTQSFLAASRTIARDDIFLCVGGDCSIVVGTVAAMANRYGSDSLHLIYIDGDTDSTPPDPDRCLGAAGMGLYFLTNTSAYWDGCLLLPGQITIIGNKEDGIQNSLPTISLQSLRDRGLANTVENALKNIPKSHHLVVHLDVDVMSRDEMPAAYSPREAGLTLAEIEQVLHLILADQRIVMFELTEFVPSKDPCGHYAKTIADVMARAFETRMKYCERDDRENYDEV